MPDTLVRKEPEILGEKRHFQAKLSDSYVLSRLRRATLFSNLYKYVCKERKKYSLYS